MMAGPMVALAALLMDMRCTRCGLYRHDHVRGLNPLGKRSCQVFARRWR
jgi:hypothetical protein